MLIKLQYAPTWDQVGSTEAASVQTSLLFSVCIHRSVELSFVTGKYHDNDFLFCVSGRFWTVWSGVLRIEASCPVDIAVKKRKGM